MLGGVASMMSNVQDELIQVVEVTAQVRYCSVFLVLDRCVLPGSLYAVTILKHGGK